MSTPTDTLRAGREGPRRAGGARRPHRDPGPVTTGPEGRPDRVHGGSLAPTGAGTAVPRPPQLAALSPGTPPAHREPRAPTNRTGARRPPRHRPGHRAVRPCRRRAAAGAGPGAGRAPLPAVPRQRRLTWAAPRTAQHAVPGQISRCWNEVARRGDCGNCAVGRPMRLTKKVRPATPNRDCSFRRRSSCWISTLTGCSTSPAAVAASQVVGEPGTTAHRVGPTRRGLVEGHHHHGRCLPHHHGELPGKEAVVAHEAQRAHGPRRQGAAHHQARGPDIGPNSWLAVNPSPRRAASDSRQWMKECVSRQAFP